VVDVGNIRHSRRQCNCQRDLVMSAQQTLETTLAGARPVSKLLVGWAMWLVNVFARKIPGRQTHCCRCLLPRHFFETRIIGKLQRFTGHEGVISSSLHTGIHFPCCTHRTDHKLSQENLKDLLVPANRWLETVGSCSCLLKSLNGREWRAFVYWKFRRRITAIVYGGNSRRHHAHSYLGGA
jgi:hypothetical protein